MKALPGQFSEIFTAPVALKIGVVARETESTYLNENWR
jgi:hypothetical protein